MAQLSVLTTTAMKSTLDALVPVFEQENARGIEFAYMPSARIERRAVEPHRFDVAIATADAIERLISAGLMQRNGSAAIARSGIGFAVRSGAERPDISSAEGFKAAVLKAGSVAMSNPDGGGQSGRHLARIFESLGIADAVWKKAKFGFGGPAGLVGHFLVRGEADIGLQQMTELRAVQGIDLVGPLPADLQVETIFSAAAFSGAPDPNGARTLIRLLTSARARPVLESNGMAAAN